MNHQDILYDTYHGIIQKILADENSFFFFKPVDPEADGAQDYYSIVIKPMCFFTIQQKLDNKEYQNQNEFIADVRQIWQNAKLYNQSTHPIYKAADRLAKKFEILSASLPRPVKESESHSALQRYIELRIGRYKSQRMHQ